jgi:hypothetical protein
MHFGFCKCTPSFKMKVRARTQARTPARSSSTAELQQRGPPGPRCRCLFDHYHLGSLQPPVTKQAAERRAGFSDARAKEVERYHNNFLLQRRGVSGSLHYSFTQNRSPATMLLFGMHA